MGAGGTSGRRGLLRGLSARLLLLTAAFVLLSEALLFLPSLAHRRHDLLREKGREAELVVLAAEGTLQASTQERLRRLAEYISLRVIDEEGALDLMLPASPVSPGAHADLRRPFWTPSNLYETARLVLQADPQPLHLIHPMRHGPTIEAVVGQRMITRELRDFARNMLVVSLLVSVATGLLVFVVIHWLMVRPVRRLTRAIAAFAAAPESPLPPDPGIAGGDEIGAAARAFVQMRQQLRGALWQQSRLAALGAAVAKISHDLRSILATALLVADRLDRSADPNVRRAAPMLVDAIERAADLARGTLDFAREGRPALVRVPLSLAGLVAEAAAAAGAPSSGAVETRFPPELGVVADRIQIGRALANLVRNAFEAGAQRITVDARREGRASVIILADDGPGLPPAVQGKLFQPFAATTRAGGSGLGLAIARDALRAHGGDIVLESTGPSGTVFRLTLPDDQAELPDALVPAPSPAAVDASRANAAPATPALAGR
jgi:signal transduction histidine kinase